MATLFAIAAVKIWLHEAKFHTNC